MYDYGLRPSHQEAILSAPNGLCEIYFEKERPVIIDAELTGAENRDILAQCIEVSQGSTIDTVTIRLPNKGEYCLQIYANDPERDAETCMLVCQYLVSFTEGEIAANKYRNIYNTMELNRQQAAPSLLQPSDRPVVQQRKLPALSDSYRCDVEEPAYSIPGAEYFAQGEALRAKMAQQQMNRREQEQDQSQQPVYGQQWAQSQSNNERRGKPVEIIRDSGSGGNYANRPPTLPRNRLDQPQQQHHQYQDHGSQGAPVEIIREPVNAKPVEIIRPKRADRSPRNASPTPANQQTYTSEAHPQIGARRYPEGGN